MFQRISVHYIEQFIQKKKACYSAAFSDSRERNTCSSSSPSLCCGRCGSGLSRNGMPASGGSHALFHCTPRSSRRLSPPGTLLFSLRGRRSHTFRPVRCRYGRFPQAACLHTESTFTQCTAPPALSSEPDPPVSQDNYPPAALQSAPEIQSAGRS